MHKISAYLRLMRWHQPAGFYLILPPTLWGLFAAYMKYPQAEPVSSLELLLGYKIDMSLLHLVIIFVLGSWVMRSAGCVINDFWDIDIDAKVARTRNRPLASGELNRTNALVLFAGLILLAVFLLLLLNPLCLLLGVIGVVGTLLYPLAKRYFQVPQLALAVVFSWGTIMAWAAVAAEVSSLEVWLLWLANVMWIISYDIQYSMCDLEDDSKLAINSAALYFGKKSPQVIIALQLLTVLLLILWGLIFEMSLLYFVFGLISALLFVIFYFYTNAYQNNLLASFRNNHWFGWLILLAIAL